MTGENMRVSVKMFAAARDAVGQEKVQLEICQNPTVSELRSALANNFPNLEPLLAQTLFAIDAEYVTDDMVIQKDADIACIPPVSGG